MTFLNFLDFYSQKDSSQYKNLTSKCITIRPELAGELLKFVNPITLPSTDLQGRTIQLWHHKNELIASVIENGKITLIPGDSVCNSLQPTERGSELLKRFQTGSLRKWQFAYIRGKISVWPDLIAAGKDGKWDRAGHVFPKESKPGHFNRKEDTSRNRKYIEAAVKTPDPRYTQKNDFGDQFLQRKMPDGKYAWAIVDRRGNIKSGGRNNFPKNWIKDNTWPGGRRFETPKFTKQFGKTPATAQFRQVLQQTHLTHSYNGNNPGKAVPARGMSSGQIGGVGHNVGMIEGLFENPESIFDTEHFFGVKCQESDLPFSNEELQLILRELAIGIYAHDTVPFFSLEFNSRGHLFPAIHPVYEKTLVGKVIGLLDYMMKGYLNGGVFHESFIMDWKAQENWNTTSALGEMIAFREYCMKNLPDENQYRSLHQMIRKSIVEEKQRLFLKQEGCNDPKFFEDHTKFTNSFRIIAKQNTFKKSENLFVLDADFDVFYDLQPDPVYQAELDKFRKVHGRDPIGYRALKKGCKKMCKEIHDHMQKFPLFKKYFSMLGTINFFSSYFLTLKSHDRIPSLEPIKRMKGYECPGEFPELPLTREVDFRTTLSDVIASLNSQYVVNYLSNIQGVNYLSNTEDGSARGQLKKEVMDKIWKKITEDKRPWEYPISSFEEFSACFSGGWVIGTGLSKSPAAGVVGSVVASIGPNIYSELKREITFYQSDAYAFQQKYLKREELQDPLEDCVDKIIHLIELTFYQSVALKESPKGIGEEARDFVYNNGGLSEFFKNFKEHEVLNPSIELPLTQAFEDLDVHIREVSQSVTGGTGMNLKTQRVQESPEVSRLLEEAWPMLQSGGVEHWSVARSASHDQSYATFKLAIEDAPTQASNYSWMEQLIQDERFSAEASEEFYIMTQAMAKGDKETFSAKLKGFTYYRFFFTYFEFQDRLERSLLHFSTLVDDPFYTRQLLKFGFSHSKADAHGYLPIHYAAMKGNIEQMKLLLKENAESIYAKSRSGLTPLMVAIQYQQVEAVSLLLEKSSLSGKTKNGYTPLLSALHEGNIEIIHLLLSKAGKKEVNTKDGRGVTPLMLAAELGDAQVIKRLLDLGADPTAESKQGKNALDIALEKGNLPLIELLKQSTTLTDQNLKSLAKYGTPEIWMCLNAFPSKFSLETSDSSKWSRLLEEALSYANMSLLEVLIEQEGAFEKQLRVEEEERKKLLPEAMSLEELPFPEVGIQAEKELLSLADTEGFYKKLISTGHFDLAAKLEGVKLFQNDLLQCIAKGGDSEFSREALRTMNFNLLKEKEVVEAFETILRRKHTGLIQPFLEASKLNPHLYTFSAEGWKYPHFLAAIDEASLLTEFLDQCNDPLCRLDLQGGKTLPYIAAETSSHDCLEILLEDMDEKKIPLEGHFGKNHLLVGAFNSFNEKTVRVILRYIKKREREVSLDSKGRTAVHYAARCGFRVLLEDLRNISFDLSRVDADGMTPLSYSIQCGQFKAAIFLVKAGCFPSQKDLKELRDSPDLPRKSKLLKLLETKGIKYEPLVDEEIPPLMPPLLSEDPDIQETFQAFLQAKDFSEKLGAAKELPLEKVISPEESKASMPVPLIFYLIELARPYPEELQKELLPLVEKVVQKHPNLCDQFRNTLSHFLVKLKEEPKFLEFVDTAARNSKGTTPIHTAAALAPKETFRLLLSRCTQFDLEQEDNIGQTPLFYAVQEKQLHHIEALLQRGANANHLNSKNIPPIVPAILKGKNQVVKKLLPYAAVDRSFTIAGKPITLLQLLAGSDPNGLFMEAHQMHPNGPKDPEARGKIAHILAQQGHLFALRYWVQKENAAAQYQDGERFAWDRAAQSGHLEVLKLFQREFPDFLNRGKMLLASAGIGGQTDIAKWLVTQRVLEGMDKDSCLQAYRFAAISGCPKTVRYFNSLFIQGPQRLFRGVFEVLPTAIRRGNEGVLKEFYEKKEFPVDLEVSRGMNSLHLASETASLKATKYLINQGADPELLDRRGKRGALEIAAQEGSLSQLRYLLDITQPLPDIQNENGYTLLHVAALAGKLSHVALLLDRGYDPNIRDGMDMTPIERAAVNARTDVVKLLTFCGADPSSIESMRSRTESRIKTGIERFTRPFQSIMAFHAAYERLLKESHESENPLHIAVRSGWKVAVALLARIDQHLHGKDHQGNTPLHFAAYAGNLEVLRILISNGGDLNLENNSGETCLDVAKRANRIEVTSFLEKILKEKAA